MAQSLYYSSTCLKEMKKNMKTLSQHKRCPSQNLNWASPEYKSGVLLLYLIP